MFFLNSLQGATLIAINCLVAKLFMTSTVRLYSILYPSSSNNKESEDSMAWAKQLSRAQLNEAEYAAFIMAPLFFLHYYHSTTTATEEAATWMATLATVGQVGYFWTRITFGYPSPAVVAVAVARYAGLGLICKALYDIAF